VVFEARVPGESGAAAAARRGRPSSVLESCGFLFFFIAADPPNRF
jgi:hypothetical protein